ncbi:3-phosphoshikimate 1-carboxyvinyltransferase [Acidaminococcus sp. NSJ-142]|jgi:3-phosphoshikimate 1-carboxyvinyltransferase|uniref:3-phosphoshikimate 1-carboxyvinyltransferase n=1 Tax=Acidaminococcus TaxID=904 RepID=UPI000E48A4F6|nr:MULTISPECIES: 3-phosphoshikimate 1-carboxyvinyltransferase [Acidaminococcus]MCD2435134.1 3-phosphoshikimate 1-carboxyvinyltransferase [Acidaminococcus hominis]RHK02971.1 3-phosphoshikimate 1-carboxyvinyltransferase [Acidaminococcus sp. AM05-11]
MTTLRITPQSLTGTLRIPSSKSMGHRALICAALAGGRSQVEEISLSRDILATCDCLRQLGAAISQREQTDGRTAFTVDGGRPRQAGKVLDCGESGSTLRFLIPLAALCDQPFTFIGSGKLGDRPLTPYEDIFQKQGLRFEKGEGSNFPLTVQGPLKPGEYTLPGSVSSQFISGLLFALPLLPGPSRLTITDKLESQSYIALTLSALQKYGIVVRHKDYREYEIPGSQHYQPQEGAVEGDYSQAAFWLTAGMLGRTISVAGMDPDSLQGDKAIIPILQRMGGQVTFENGVLVSRPSVSQGTVIDAADCPDIVPILSVAAALSQGHTDIIHAERLRIKECDRLEAMATELTKLGARITQRPDGLSIDGVEALTGGTVDCWNDHRIAMSLAIASIQCQGPVTLVGAECVKKSYPDFWRDFQKLGGQYEQCNG